LRISHAVAASGVLVGGVALFMGGAQWTFAREGMMIPIVAPLVGFGGTTVFGLVFNFLLEQLERARIRSVLDRYVSRNVAELVLDEREEFEKALLGEKRRVTVLFSDIRGFTTMTEGSEPEKLVEQMNEYFYNMVDAVLAAQGTLQQFVGDAIMAVWGNTHIVDAGEGARQAMRTALKMSRELDELNVMWAGNPRRRAFEIGIGVNHGEVVVGSLGHPQRMEFTAIGDGINTAARLETATKQFGVRILVGEAVEELTRGEFCYRRVARVRFKGKVKAIEVYTVLGESGAPCPVWLEEYHAAVELYRRREFAKALAAFEEVRQKIGNEDKICGMYVAECNACREHAPGTEWDGSFGLTEK
jgi:adenylate cyclase